jgi:hypothetical protein
MIPKWAVASSKKRKRQFFMLHIGVLSSVKMDTIQRGVSEHYHTALLDTHFGIYFFSVRNQACIAN